MAKTTLTFATSASDQYKATITEIARQQEALNTQYARTTLALQGQETVTKKQTAAYLAYVDAQKKAAGSAANVIGLSNLGIVAPHKDIAQFAADAADAKEALRDVSAEMAHGTQEGEKHSAVYQSLSRSLGVARLSLTYAARGMAEFTGAGREATGLITALSSITDVQSAVVVGAGLVFQAASKKVQEYAIQQEKADIATAHGSKTLAEFLQKQQNLIDLQSPSNQIKSAPDILGRVLSSTVDSAVQHPESVNMANLATTLAENYSKAIVDQKQHLKDLETGLYGLAKAQEASIAKSSETLTILAASGATYDEVYRAVVQYRKEVGMVDVDATKEAANVTYMTELYVKFGATLRSFNVIMTVQEENAQRLRDSLDGIGASLNKQHDQYRVLNTAIAEYTGGNKAAAAAITALTGQQDVQEQAIKRMVPQLMEEHRLRGDIVPLNEKGAQQLRTEATLLIVQAEARDRLNTVLTEYAARTKQLADVQVQAAYRALDTQISIAQQRADIQKQIDRQLADFQLQQAYQREDVARSHGYQLADFELQILQQRQKQARDTADALYKIELNYQESVRQLNQNYSDSLFDISVRRDAKALVQADLTRQHGLRDAAFARERAIFDQKQADEKAAREQQIAITIQRANMERDYQRQLEAMQRQAERERKAQQLNQQRAAADFELGLQRQREAEARSIERQTAEIERAFNYRMALLGTTLAGAIADTEKATKDLADFYSLAMEKNTRAHEKQVKQAAAATLGAVASGSTDAVKVSGAAINRMLTDFILKLGKQKTELDSLWTLVKTTGATSLQVLSDKWGEVERAVLQFKDNAVNGLNDLWGNINDAGIRALAGLQQAWDDFKAGLSITWPKIPGMAGGGVTGSYPQITMLHPHEAVLPLSNPARTLSLLQNVVAPALGIGMQGAGGGMARLDVHLFMNNDMLDARIESKADGLMVRVFTEAYNADTMR